MQKKKKDRFKNYEEDVKHLVLDFESMEESGGSRYFDLDEMEIIIDFYLDNSVDGHFSTDVQVKINGSFGATEGSWFAGGVITGGAPSEPFST